MKKRLKSVSQTMALGIAFSIGLSGMAQGEVMAASNKMNPKEQMNASTVSIVSEKLNVDNEGNVDAKQLKEALKNNEQVDIVLNPSNNGVRFRGDAVLEGSKLNKQIRFVRDNITSTVQLKLLNIEGIVKSFQSMPELHTSPADIEFRIEMNVFNPEEDENVAAFREAFQREQGELITEPIYFYIHGYNMKMEANDGFGIPLDEIQVTQTLDKVIDVEKATGFSIDDEDYSLSTFSFAPFKYTVKGNKSIVSYSISDKSIIGLATFNKTPFEDILDHWARADIELLTNRLILKGKSDTTFEPESFLTRADFVTTLVKSLGLKPRWYEGLPSFSDINREDGYADWISTAVKYGLASGYSDHTFRPNKEISREQMAVLTMKALKHAGVRYDLTDEQVENILRNFTDQDQVSNWARKDLATAIDLGIISGVTSNRLAPQKLAKRGESAPLIKLYLQKANYLPKQ